MFLRNIIVCPQLSLPVEDLGYLGTKVVKTPASIAASSVTLSQRQVNVLVSVVES